MNRLRGHERGQVLALAAAPIEALMAPWRSFDPQVRETLSDARRAQQ